MSNEMISVPRELAELCAQCLSNSGYCHEANTLRALLAKPAEQHQGEPVVYRCRHSENEPWFFSDKPGYWEWQPLYTRPAEQPAPVSSSSDKYKAELYDEVWQLARDMGFGNVTDALMKLKKQPAPVAVVLPEQWHPIETAPKDETEIILRKGDRVTAGAWIEWSKHHSEHHSTTGEYLGQVEYDSGASWGSWDGGFCEDDEPTHWQPLPPPPQQ